VVVVVVTVVVVVVVAMKRGGAHKALSATVDGPFLRSGPTEARVFVQKATWTG